MHVLQNTGAVIFFYEQQSLVFRRVLLTVSLTVLMIIHVKTEMLKESSSLFNGYDRLPVSPSFAKLVKFV